VDKYNLEIGRCAMLQKVSLGIRELDGYRLIVESELMDELRALG